MQRGSATFRQDIADVLFENALGRGQFVGEEIMPVMPVGVHSGNFAKIAFGQVKTKAVDDKRSTAGNFNQVTHETTEDNFTCVERGLEEPVDERNARILANYFDAETAAAAHCRYYLRLNREARIAAIAFSTTVMSSYTTAVSTSWDTAATCTPVEDVAKAKENLILQINGLLGEGARIIGVGNLTARRHLKVCTDIKNRHYSGGNVNSQDPTDAQLAEILDLDAVYFSGAKRAGSYIWNASRFGIYAVSDSVQFSSTPMFGKTMLYRDNTPTDMMVESYRDETRRSDIVRVMHDSTEKLLTARAGHLLTNIT